MSSEKEKCEEVAKLQARLVFLCAWQTCLNCAHWGGEGCNLFQAVPPPHVIVNGCRDYQADIPF